MFNSQIKDFHLLFDISTFTQGTHSLFVINMYINVTTKLVCLVYVLQNQNDGVGFQLEHFRPQLVTCC